MKKKIITLYSFSELPEESKKKLIEKHRDNISSYCNQYDWEDLWEPAIKAFEKIFDVDLGISKNNYGGWYSNPEVNDRSWFIFESPDFMVPDIALQDLSGIKLLKYIGKVFRQYCEKGKYYSTAGEYIEVDGKKTYKYKQRYSKITKEWNNCPLTGCCGDHFILGPIAEYLNLERGEHGFYLEDGTRNSAWLSYTFQDLMEACARSMIDNIEYSEEYQQSDEFISEEIENRYEDREYYKDGTEFNSSVELEDFDEKAA